ncbi:MAG: cytochrome b N-terminal domain-containing protein, partial [Burkholderiales bacterium]
MKRPAAGRSNPMTTNANPIPPSRQAAAGNAAARLFHALERGFDRAFGAAANPLRQLGALAFWLFWVVTASGIYVYAFFDTSVEGAWRSLAALSREQWFAGGVMRSLHRYASDGFAVVMLLHLARELAYGRYRGFRWFSWLTGVPLIWLALASGVVGYWLVWDELAQFIGIATTEWFGWLPGFGDTLVRNFVTAEAVSDRFFSLLMFLHIGISLLLLLGMWVHIQRITGARTQPDRSLGWGTFATLLVLSLAKPALSQAPANLGHVPVAPGLDWFFLFPFPLVYRLSPGDVWFLAAAATLLLCALPWLGRARREPVAVVDPENCNGCARCFADCPYAAVIMQPRADERPADRIAVVIDDLCASCGICSGACPSSTPFRSLAELKTGIDMPQLPIGAVRSRLQQAIEAVTGPAPVVVFGCDRGASVAALAGAGTATLSLPCIGMLPPSFIEYALRSGVAGVMVAGCGEGDCEFRFGTQWTAARLAGTREPHLRRSVDPGRVRLA